VAKLGAEIVRVAAPVTSGSLERCRVLFVLAPSEEFKAEERDAIVGFVHAGGSDRELPYSGGRAVEGGTPFGWQLDQAGAAGQTFAAFATPDGGGKVVVLGDAMATLLLGTPEGVRLTGVPRDPSRTTYWGKDSAIFMEEVLTWQLIAPESSRQR
jgi:hypothetical protein